MPRLYSGDYNSDPDTHNHQSRAYPLLAAMFAMLTQVDRCVARLVDCWAVLVRMLPGCTGSANRLHFFGRCPLCGLYYAYCRLCGNERRRPPGGEESCYGSCSGDPEIAQVTCTPLPSTNRLKWLLPPAGSLTRGMRFLVLSACFTVARAVTCRHCHDQIEGCAGGDSCPFLTGTAANSALVATAATATTVFTVARLLPREWLSVLDQPKLRSILAVLKVPLPGTVIDCTGWTIQQLLQGFRDRSAPRHAITGELTTLLGGATPEEREVIKTAMELMRLHASSEGDPNAHKPSGETTGVLQLLWAYAGQITERNGSSVSALQGGESEEAAGSAAAATKLTAKQTPSATDSKFYERIHVFNTVCHALGVANCLLLARFFTKVVWDSINRDKLGWQLAQSLVSVYFEDIDNSETLTLSNIFERGGQDTRLARARTRIFRPSVKGGEQGGGDSEPPKYNGKCSRDAKTCCISFNLGKPHPAGALKKDGTCRHNHECDHWVNDKGPRGRCGGKHPRSECDNPNKCDKPL